MSTFLRDAQYYVKKIDHLHANAGSDAYSQAVPYLAKLEKILANAHNSSTGRNDVSLIIEIIENAHLKMEEIQKRSKVE